MPRGNPSLFGEDVESLFWMGIGAGIGSAVSAKVVGPVLRGVLPDPLEGATGSPQSKLVDAVASAGAAVLAGEVLEKVSRPIGNLVKRGGLIAAVMKAAGAVIPGISFEAKVPGLEFLPQIGMGSPMAPLPAGAPRALPAPAPLPFSALFPSAGSNPNLAPDPYAPAAATAAQARYGGPSGL